jgi:heme/copper-type cytochrome/quinol oxidase subunit 3
MLLISSLPIQSSLLFIKVGLLLQSIEGLGQNIAYGFMFIIIQFKEYIYAYFNISYSIYGSLFYFTTGIHGVHVFIGTFIILILILFVATVSNVALYYEFHQSFQL